VCMTRWFCVPLETKPQELRNVAAHSWKGYSFALKEACWVQLSTSVSFKVTVVNVLSVVRKNYTHRVGGV
jgi:hypothetical protein